MRVGDARSSQDGEDRPAASAASEDTDRSQRRAQRAVLILKSRNQQCELIASRIAGQGRSRGPAVRGSASGQTSSP